MDDGNDFMFEEELLNLEEINIFSHLQSNMIVALAVKAGYGNDFVLN